MKTMKAIPAVLALALVALGAGEVQAQAPATDTAAPAVDPIGTYDFQATLGIEMRTGTLEIERNEAGDLVGEAWLEGEGDPAIIESVVINGLHVDMYAVVNGSMPVTFALDFTGTEFAGTITAGDQTIDVDGQRRAE
jgi:hypothetical protein